MSLFALRAGHSLGVAVDSGMLGIGDELQVVYSDASLHPAPMMDLVPGGNRAVTLAPRDAMRVL